MKLENALQQQLRIKFNLKNENKKDKENNHSIDFAAKIDKEQIEKKKAKKNKRERNSKSQNNY